MRIRFLEKKNDIGLLILRLSVGVMMLLHGISKLFNGLGGIQSILASNNMPEFLSYGVLIGEVVAPIFIIVGLRTRLSAAVMAFNCFFAWFLVHRGELFSIGAQGGWAVELLGLFFFSSLTLMFTGGGKYSASKKSMWD